MKQEAQELLTDLWLLAKRNTVLQRKGDKIIETTIHFKVLHHSDIKLYILYHSSNKT